MKRIKKLIFSFAIFIAVNAQGQQWKQYLDSANKYYNEQNQDSALLLAKKAETTIKGSIPHNDTALAEVYGLTGSIYEAKENLDTAELFLIKASEIKIAIFGAEDSISIESIAILADFYSYYLMTEKAINAANQVKQKWEAKSGIYSLNYADACNLMAIVYSRGALRDKKLYEKALENYFESKKIIETVLGKLNKKYENLCWNMGFTYKTMMDYNKAVSYFSEGLLIVVKLNQASSSRYRNYCVHLGEVYRDLQYYDKAEELLQEAIKSDEKRYGKQSTYYAYTNAELANLYTETGQYRKAIILYQTAKDIYEKDNAKNRFSLFLLMSYMGLYYQTIKEYDKSYEFFTKANELLDQKEDIINIAITESALADILIFQGQFSKADSILGRSIATMEKATLTKTIQYLSMQLLNASIKFERGSYTEAINLCDSVLNNLGKLVNQDHHLNSEALLTIGLSYWRKGELQQARSNLDKLRDILKTKITSQFSFFGEIQKEEFIKKSSSMLNIINQFYLANYVNSRADLSDMYMLRLQMNALLLKSSQWLINKANSSTDSTEKVAYRDWITLKQQIARWNSIPVDEREVNIEDLEVKANDLEKKVSKLLSPADYEIIRNIDINKLGESLLFNEAAVEFAEFKHYDGKKWTDSTYYVALVLRKGQPGPELVKLFEKNQLDTHLKYKSTSAGQQKLDILYSIKAGNNLQKSIYDLIWKPLESSLTGIEKVYFSPAGALHKIAFAALPVSKTQVLSDKYQLVQLNTTASVADQSLETMSASDTIIMYGGVQYDADSSSIKRASLSYSATRVTSRSLPEDLSRDGMPSFTYLFGAEKEVRNISKLAGQMKYSFRVAEGINATEESFKSLAGNNSPAVLHIATHGFFFPDPKGNKKDDRMGGGTVFKQSDNPLIRSGLALAGANNTWKGRPVAGVEDGILTAYEVSNMYLPNTKLVVLSACETGLGDIQGSEGVYGLQRAFKMAGVQNLVMSLWKVPDFETAEFMEEFYKNLFARQTINDSFYNTQTMMKNKYRTSPYKWAAWVLVR